MTTLARPPVLQRVGGGVLAAFAAVYVIWGRRTSSSAWRWRPCQPLLMAGVVLVAGAVMLAITSRMRGAASDPVGWRQWRASAITGGLLLLGGNGGVSFGEQYVASGIVPCWLPPSRCSSRCSARSSWRGA